MIFASPHMCNNLYAIFWGTPASYSLYYASLRGGKTSPTNQSTATTMRWQMELCTLCPLLPLPLAPHASLPCVAPLLSTQSVHLCVQVVLLFRRMHALCPESYRQSLAAANALRKQSGKCLVNRALCYGMYASDINVEVEEARPVLGSKAQGRQCLILCNTPMAVHCTEVDDFSLVARVHLGSGNTFIMETISAVDSTAKG